VDRGESAGSPYEFNQLLPISLGSLRTERADKGGAEREGPTGVESKGGR
jgi:hypothetical protein